MVEQREETWPGVTGVTPTMAEAGQVLIRTLQPIIFQWQFHKTAAAMVLCKKIFYKQLCEGVSTRANILAENPRHPRSGITMQSI